jgi:transposase-like protein
MIGIVDVDRAEADLAAGELACPGCGAALRRWGHARSRRVRDHASTTLTLRPRRARCTACGATHVLLLGAVLPRRADTTAVIGTALLASADGAGYGRIAADLGRSTSTVRRWVRSVRSAHTEWLRAQALGWIVALDGDLVATLAPSATRLGDALNAVAAAALTVRDHLTPHVPIWTVISSVTGWRLVPPRGG